MRYGVAFCFRLTAIVRGYVVGFRHVLQNSRDLTGKPKRIELNPNWVKNPRDINISVIVIEHNTSQSFACLCEAQLDSQKY